MGLADLPTLAEMRSRPMPCPKPGTRAEASGTKANDDERALKDWRRAVFQRDKGRCRCCGRRVKQTLDNLPERAEAHHLVSRTVKALRYDVRNGVLLCALDHIAVTRGTITIVQTARDLFIFNARSFLDGTKPLEFKA